MSYCNDWTGVESLQLAVNKGFIVIFYIFIKDIQLKKNTNIDG